MGPQIKSSVTRLGASCRKLGAVVLATGLLAVPATLLLSPNVLAAGAAGTGTNNSTTVACGEASVTVTHPPSDPSQVSVQCNPGASPNPWWEYALMGAGAGALGMWFLQRRRNGAAQANDQTKLLNSGGRDFLSSVKPDTRFSDVAGIDEAKAELEDLVQIIKNPELYKDLGVKPPKGVLLYGPPGNGKTLMARAVAGEAGVEFFAVNGSDFVQMFVGVGAARVRDLFNAAKKKRPAIIFIDEFDAIGGKRGGGGAGGGHSEHEQTINQLLTEIDGFAQDTGVTVIAATNRVDMLDPAIVRKGRFNWHIKVDRPDVNGRRAILAVHTKGMPLADDVDIDYMARQTPGLSGADLAALCEEAAMLRARKYNREHKEKLGVLFRPSDPVQVTKQDFEEALERVAMGPDRKSLILTEADKWRCARHELGHAIVGHVLDETQDVSKVTLIPRGQSLGATWFVDKEDRQLITREELINRAAAMLGGLVAEKIYYKEDSSSGPSGDLQSVTGLMKQAVCLYGMGDRGFHEKYGYRIFPEPETFGGAAYSDATHQAVDLEIGKLLNLAEMRARKILAAHRNAIDEACDILMTPGKETMSGTEFGAIVEKHLLQGPEIDLAA